MAGSEQTRILIVEDDDKLAKLVSDYLTAMGFETFIESRGDTAPARIIEENPDLVVLDVMLPGMDGLKVCKAVRTEYRGPILMLTALDDEIDEVVGLEIGADDYMAKPVRPRLLVAHINALLRRSQSPEKTEAIETEVLKIGPLVLERESRSARIEDRELDLTTAEFDLLAFLMERAGEVLSRESIYEDLRGIDYDGLDRSIDLRIARLRKKLGDDGKSPNMIKSVRGVGYLMVSHV